MSARTRLAALSAGLAAIVAGAAAAPTPPGPRFRSWADEVLEEARGGSRPILLLVSRAGARTEAAEQESLGDPDTLALLERDYLCVRADADERPDLAEAYASALILMSETAGRPALPFVAALTADARPIAGAELAPGGRPDAGRVSRLLAATAEEYRQRRPEVEARAGATVAALREGQVPAPPRGPLADDVVSRAVRGLAEAFDPRRGTFGAGGALPHGPLRLLLAGPVRAGRPAAVRMASTALRVLAADPAGRREGRIDDEALLLSASVGAFDATGLAAHREMAQAIAGWARNALDPAGGFVASLPSEGPRDERVFAAASGAMIRALALSGTVLGRPEDLETARIGARGVLARLGPPESLRRFARGPLAGGPSFLEDHAFLAEGLLELHEATGEPRFREDAEAIVEAALARFFDTARQGFFDTDATNARLAMPRSGEASPLVRTKSGYDTRLPSGNGVMASVLLRLAAVTGERRYAELARGTVDAFRGELQRAPRGMESLAAAAAELLAGRPLERDPGPPLPSTETRGPVTVRLEVAGDGPDRLEARALISIAPGWHVVAPVARAEAVAPLSITLLSARPRDAPRFPPAAPALRRFAEPIAAYTGETTVSVPLPPAAAPRVRVRIAFQACDGTTCRDPESVLLEAAAPAPVR